jgi:ABC-type bacteriocin/lantibiotic exporter with double-glycine peptidase domain
LLTGAYADFTGSVLINDVPIGNYNLQSLRSQIGIVLSQQDVFAGTLWENITLGADNVDAAYITTLVQQTGLSSFVASLKEGFDTGLDPTGNRLPRNVVLKILLVRAMAHKPKLLLLEEPWEGIDEQTAGQIKRLLLAQKETTVIVATNDPAFIRECDQAINLS